MDWIGAVFGILGSVVLAHNSRISKYGFVLYLVSNIAWIIYAMVTSQWAILAQTLMFAVISVYGIYRWFWACRLKIAIQPVDLSYDQ